MNEVELLDWLRSRLADRRVRRREAGREVARQLLARMGDPQDRLVGVHVVGTAGKGTVASMLTDRLAGAGIPVVTHMSPHVHDVRERFLVDGELPPWPAVAAAAARVRTAAEAMEATTGVGPSYFAATAAIAWELGRRRGAEVAVIEAGIGGRGDATNIMSRPDVLTVFTAIDLDHLDALGRSVERIAGEKSGVLPGRSDAVLGPQPHDLAAEVVAAAAAAEGCRLHPVEAQGEWQADAAATVDVASALLESRLAWPIPTRPARLPPGRLEVVELADRRLVLDGAHNPMKLDGLALALADQPRPAVVIAGLGRGKDLPGSAEVLARLGTMVVCTEYGRGEPMMPASHPAVNVALAVDAAGGEARVGHTPERAARLARHFSEPGDTILVTGSFLHLHEVQEALRGG